MSHVEQFKLGQNVKRPAPWLPPPGLAYRVISQHPSVRHTPHFTVESWQASFALFSGCFLSLRKLTTTVLSVHIISMSCKSELGSIMGPHKVGLILVMLLVCWGCSSQGYVPQTNRTLVEDQAPKRTTPSLPRRSFPQRLSAQGMYFHIRV